MLSLLGFSMSALLTVSPGSAQQPSQVTALPIGQWSQFTEPDEGAFSIAVPKGWQAQGGLGRRNALQFWPWLVVQAPDQSALIALGDGRRLQSYILPTQMLAMAGMGPGAVYAAGVTRYVISPYQPASSYAPSYLRNVLPDLCQNAKIGQPQDRQDIASRFRQYGWQSTAVEVPFTCTRNNRPQSGTLILATSLHMTPYFGPQAGNWFPSLIAGAMTPPPLLGVAVGLMAHMLETYRVNPQWAAAQSHEALTVAQIAAQTQQVISRDVMQSWAAHGATIDRIMEQDSRARLGIDVVENPATGERYTVPNTYQYYWQNARGRIVGTGTDTPPSADFTRMDRPLLGR